MKNEILFYKQLEKYANNINERELLSMLNHIESVLPLMMKTKTYKKVEDDVLNGHVPWDEFSQHVSRLNPKFDYSTMVWILNLHAAMNSGLGVEAVMIETNLFIAAQKANVFRIENDKMRLLIMYSHFSVLKLLGEIDKWLS